jgi:hypothetical protein
MLCTLDSSFERAVNQAGKYFASQGRKQLDVLPTLQPSHSLLTEDRVFIPLESGAHADQRIFSCLRGLEKWKMEAIEVLRSGVLSFA